jgi:hypothetical protein
MASDIEQGVCRTLISLSLPPLTARPLKPGEGRVWKFEEEESYSYKHAGFSSSAGDMLANASFYLEILYCWGLTCLKLGRMRRKEKIRR